MHAGKPDLAQAFIVNRIRSRPIIFIPQHRLKGFTLLIQRQRMTRPFNAIRNIPIFNGQRPHHHIPGPRQFIQRQSIGVNRIPDPHKLDNEVVFPVMIPERIVDVVLRFVGP